MKPPTSTRTSQRERVLPLLKPPSPDDVPCGFRCGTATNVTNNTRELGREKGQKGGGGEKCIHNALASPSHSLHSTWITTTTSLLHVIFYFSIFSFLFGIYIDKPSLATIRCVARRARASLFHIKLIDH